MEQRIYLAIALLAILGGPRIAGAQCSPVPVIVTNDPLIVSDPTVEASVTTGSKTVFNASLQAFSAISPSTFQQEFPGWSPLPVNSRDVAKQNTMDSLSTYLAASTDAQAQVNYVAGLQPEPAVLAQLQALTHAVQALVNVNADLVHEMAVNNAEMLNERARPAATQAVTWAEWVKGVI